MGDEICNISIEPDDKGFTGRECPNNDCLGYFKIEFGTGLKGSTDGYCPYCGHKDLHDKFWTKEQVEYAKSLVLHQITGELINQLKKSEVKPDPNAFLSIGIEVKGKPHPIHYYREKKLEQVVICNNCTLRYTIYGVFGYCPDCGIHNSLQIFNENLNIIDKMLILSEEADENISKKLIENAQEDAVSSFDGFGREVCKVNADKSRNPSQAENISFQNIKNAKDRLINSFGIDIATSISSEEWDSIKRSFQKRHVMTHRMGVIDQEYIDKTGEDQTLLGRKVEISKEEVKEFINGLRKIGDYIFTQLNKE